MNHSVIVSHNYTLLPCHLFDFHTLECTVQLLRFVAKIRNIYLGLPGADVDGDNMMGYVDSDGGNGVGTGIKLWGWVKIVYRVTLCHSLLQTDYLNSS